jgi:hypothetical protein
LKALNRPSIVRARAILLNGGSSLIRSALSEEMRSEALFDRDREASEAINILG